MNTFVRLERLIENLVEKPFGRFFRPKLHPADLTKQLLQALEENYIPNGRGGYLTPNHYELFVSDMDYQKWQFEPGLQALSDHLAVTLRKLTLELMGNPTSTPRVIITAQSTLSPGQVKVAAYHADTLPNDVVVAPFRELAISDTKPLDQAQATVAQQHYFHIESKRIQLTMPIIRLGRAADNDIVLSDAGIAKYQAQFHWRQQQYHIQNLNQHVPLSVNNHRINESIPLKHGDTVQLGQTIGIFHIIHDD
ncbi:MAG: FhaA domain-containing protein [Chloroflexota bacterium]